MFRSCFHCANAATANWCVVALAFSHNVRSSSLPRPISFPPTPPLSKYVVPKLHQITQWFFCSVPSPPWVFNEYVYICITCCVKYIEPHLVQHVNYKGNSAFSSSVCVSMHDAPSQHQAHPKNAANHLEKPCFFSKYVFFSYSVSLALQRRNGQTVDSYRLVSTLAAPPR